MRNLIRLWLKKKKCRVLTVGESSEHEHRKKLNKIREDVNKRVKDIREQFAKIEKVKVEALKKTEEMRRFSEHEIAKLEENIAKSDLTEEVKKKLNAEIALLKSETENRATELRTRISGTMIPL
jgi:cell division protein ZapA (FtsZ GTPase activity inhibitor)